MLCKDRGTTKRCPRWWWWWDVSEVDRIDRLYSCNVQMTDHRDVNQLMLYDH